MTDTSLTEALAVSVGKLAVLRQVVAERSDRLKAQRAAFEATLADELARLEADRRAVEAEESAVRGMALVEYETSGRKQPAAGVTIAVTKRYAIDEAAGLAWAKAHGLCLIPEALDVKAAQKMATVTPLPFVAITEEPTVRIASDLVAALEQQIGATS